VLVLGSHVMSNDSDYSTDLTDGNVDTRVLIVEDDLSLKRLVADYLEQNGIVVSEASTAADVSRKLKAAPVDLILLDLQLGRENGLDVLRSVRASSDTPVIIMTAHRSDEVDRIVGLELGADDYLIKPVGLRELLARIRVVLRRGMIVANNVRRDREEGICRFGAWVLDRKTRQLLNGEGQPVPLTKGEYGLLTAFTESPRQILSREQLLQATRVHEDILDRSIDVQILRLRRKLEVDINAPKIIRTERGVGYIFDLDVLRVRPG